MYPCLYPGWWRRISGECLEIRASVIGLLFPEICIVCGGSLVRSEEYLCTGCMADFPFSDEAYCIGEVLAHFDECCRPEKLHSLFYYNRYSNYRKLIYAVKYHSYQELGRFLGRLLGEKIKMSCIADCIIPVPLHRKREKERGFNQAYEIALGVGEFLGIEVMNDVIFRVRNNVSQTGKNAAERQDNVENIFEMRSPEKIAGRHVLLVDDVITTGATIGSCLRVLSKAKEVKFSLGCLAQTV